MATALLAGPFWFTPFYFRLSLVSACTWMWLDVGGRGRERERECGTEPSASVIAIGTEHPSCTWAWTWMLARLGACMNEHE